MDSQWEFEPLLAERLDKARQLLTEDEAYRGDSGLKRYLEGMDATATLHHTVLDGTDLRRPDLSPPEQQMALVALLRYVLAVLAQPVVSSLLEPACTDALYAAVETFAEPEPADGSPLESFLTLTSAALLVLRRSGDNEEALEDLVWQLGMLVGDKSAKDGSWIDRTAPLRQLEAWLDDQQEQTGLLLALTRRELQLACCYLLQKASRQLLQLRMVQRAANTQQGARLPDHIVLEIAMSATQSLLQKAPKEGQPSALMCLAELFLAGRQPDEAAKAYQMAIQKAAEVKDRAVEAGAAVLLATVLLSCRVEARWSLEEVSSLLRQADTALASCRRWLPNATLSVLKHDLASTWRSVKATAAQYPGQDRLPLPVIDDEAAPSVLGRLCAGCGRGSVHLQACSACRSAHYCSRECQVQHWKQGGHKQECAGLAAARRRGGGQGVQQQ